MLKLFVDDNRVPSSDWMVVRTITEAIRAIARWDFDEISLDHDIEGYEEENYTPVAYFIAVVYKGKRAPKITIHSGNSIGAKRIADILEDAGIGSEYIPYEKLKHEQN